MLLKGKSNLQCTRQPKQQVVEWTVGGVIACEERLKLWSEW